ncbi:hypothetical protein Taro_019235 [Colocasia esculenta]|uniref:DUF4283 domain-containing protein n=1 Tax=Colocasia esculenta TaxID=4460 RepID=A0A843UVS5_COLES|nr:hypothetical protein [Colocasia esculenta]
MAALGGPPPAGGISFAKVVAASLALHEVGTKVHLPAFTDHGEPVVFFSKEEMAASLKPFLFAVVAKTAYGRPTFPEIRNVGPVLQISHATELLLNMKAARVCIELDLTKPRPDRLWIGMGNIGGYWQDITYINLPLYCFSCHRLGHSKDVCRSVGGGNQRQTTAASVNPNPQRVWMPVHEGLPADVGEGS